MADSPYATTLPVTVITGSAGTGKTQALIARIAELLASGVAPERIGVFAATPDACDALQARLAEATGSQALPTIKTPLAFELSLLGMPEIASATGIGARVMLRYEENIFLEDMKTGGVQPKRLAGMLKFLYRSACDLEKMDYAWFYNGEEENTFNLLKDLQRAAGAFVRPMVPAEAYRTGCDFPAVLDRLAYDYVFVDDYPLLTKASQCLLIRAARKGFTAAGDTLARVTAFEEYPYAPGLDDLLAANPHAERVDLCEAHCSGAVNTALNTLLADEALSGETRTTTSTAAGIFKLLSFANPSGELAGITATVRDLIAHGTAPEAIAIAATKPVWEHNVKKALIAAGIPLSQRRHHDISGDVRSKDASFEARIVTLLRLAANPDDRMALRSWCGFGDYLANSALFCELAKSGSHLELGTTMISTAGPESELFAQQRNRILEALAEARMYLAQLTGLSGKALVRRAAKVIDPTREPSAAFWRTLGKLDDAMTAQDIINALEQQVLFPRFDTDGVRTGLTSDFAGMRPQAMIACGLVNGFSPEREYFDPTIVERDKRPGILATEAAKTYAAAGKAEDTLVLTYFTSAPLMQAEQARLKVERVRLLNGERVCEIHPSETIRALTGVRFNG